MKSINCFSRVSKWCLFALTIALFAAPSAFATASTWSGGASTDWNTAGNWSAGVPAAGVATINTVPANVCTISANLSATPTDIQVGQSGTGQVNQTGGTASTGSGNFLYIGAGGTGTYNQIGGTLTASKILLGNQTGGTGTATLNVGGTMSATNGAAATIFVCDAGSTASTSTGTINVNSGGILNSEDDLVIAYAGSSTSSGTVNIAAGGTLNVASTAGRWVQMSEYNTVNGTLNVNGGTLNLNANTAIEFNTQSGGSGNNGTVTLNLNSGAIKMWSGNQTGAGSTGVIDFDHSNNSTSPNNTVNLNGGTLTVGQIVSTQKKGARTFNFNGGTLKPTTNSTAFFNSGLVAANVSTNGAIIDTAGYNITIGQALGTGPAGDGGLTKNGNGTLTLAGANTYTNTTTINAGTLAITAAGTGIAASSAVAVNNAKLIVGTGSTASIVAGPVTVNSGGTLVVSNSATVSGVVTNNPGGTLSGGGSISGAVVLKPSSGGLNATADLSGNPSGTLTMSGGLTLNGGNVLNFGCTGASSSSQIAVTGAYASPIGGTATINLSNTGITGGTMTLITWSSGTPLTADFTIGTAAPVGFSQTLQVSGSSLQVVFRASAPSVAFWNGVVDNSWGTADSGANFNWATDAAGATTTGGKPGPGSAVTFSVSGVNTPATTLDANYEIGTLAFTSPGSASIGGSHTLTVDGNLTVNSGAGPVTISATGYGLGVDQTWENDSSSDLTVSSPVSGAHALTINNTSSGVTTLAGTNSYSGATTVVAGTLNVSGALSNTAVSVNSGSVLNATAVNALGGAASLTVASGGTATLSQSNNFTGATANSGTLQLAAGGALAASALTLNANATLQLRANANTTFSAASIAIGGNETIDVNALTSSAGAKLTLNGALGTAGEPTISITGGTGYTLALGAITGNDNDNGSATVGTTFDVASGLSLSIASLANTTGGSPTFLFADAGNATVGSIATVTGSTTSGRNISVIFNQTGTVTLTGTNSFEGKSNQSFLFAVNNGTVVLDSNGALNTQATGLPVFTLGSTAPTVNNASLLLGDAFNLTGGISVGSGKTFTVQDWDYGAITIGGQNTSGVNTFACNFTLGANPNTGKSVTLVAATGGEVDFTGIISTNGTDTTAGITVGDGVLAGTVKLTGINTFAGGTIINSGTLALSSQAGPCGNGAMTVNDGGTLQVTISGTSQLSPSTLTVGSSSGATLGFANVSSTTTAPLNPTTFTINGTASVNIVSLGALAVGTYPLVSNYESGTVALGTVPARVNAHLTTSGNVLSLVVDSFAPDVWAAGTGSWDTNLLNWKVNGVASKYADGDVAKLDDTAAGSGPFTVTVTSASVLPSTVLVNNSAKSYTIGGNPIAGSAALTKSGSGTLIIANTNTYTGGTTISAGALQLGDGSANNGAVAGTISDNSVLIFANPADQTYSSVLSGTGSVVKTAAGILTLGLNNLYSGDTTVEAGAVLLPNGAAASFGSGTLILSNATLVVQPGNGNAYNSANSDYIGNSVAVLAGTTNIIDNSVQNFGNLWVGGDTGLWTGSGTVVFQNSGTVVSPSVLWNGNPLQNFNGTINIGATNSSYRMLNGMAYNSSAGGGTGTSVPTFDAHNVAWVLGDNGYSASQVQDISCTLVQMGSISASNQNTTIRGNSATPVTFEVGALNTSTTYAGTINDWSSSANTCLTKVGSGTLTLSGANTYTGDTTVNAGTLELAQSVPTLNSNSTVSIARGACLKLDVSTVINQVAALVLNGVYQTTGVVYNSDNSGGYITGSGRLLVGALPGPSGPGMITNSISGSTLTLTWPAGQNWRLVSQTNSLSTGLNPNPNAWFTVPGFSDGSATITIDPTQPTVFYQLVYP